jgi:Na+/melibiose symporter-like transporter
MTMTLWAGLCLVLFVITFLFTRERIRPVQQQNASPKRDFLDLLKNSPWRVMAVMTLVHFAILSFRGGALYNYYHHYADKTAMYDFVARLGLTGGAGSGGGLLDTLGYLVHPDKSNAADVFNSIINMVGTATTIVVILLSPPLSRRFGKKAVAAARSTCWGRRTSSACSRSLS